MRKLSYFVAASIDGFIGAPDGEADFFNQYVTGEYRDHLATECRDSLPVPARRMFGCEDAPLTEYDTVVMGRATYEVGGVARPYAHLREIVVSRSLTEAPDPAVEIVSGDVAARIRELKQEEGLGIYLCGGANLAAQLRDEVDELVVKSYPVVLGSGMPMFDADFRVDAFRLDSVRAFDNGVVVRRYQRER